MNGHHSIDQSSHLGEMIRSRDCPFDTTDLRLQNPQSMAEWKNLCASLSPRDLDSSWHHLAFEFTLLKHDTSTRLTRIPRDRWDTQRSQRHCPPIIGPLLWDEEPSCKAKMVVSPNVICVIFPHWRFIVNA